MPYQIIDAKDAPAPPRKQSSAATEATGIIKQLKRGSVARVEPDEGTQTLRGLRFNLTKAAKQAGIALQMWDVDGSEIGWLDRGIRRSPSEALDIGLAGLLGR